MRNRLDIHGDRCKNPPANHPIPNEGPPLFIRVWNSMTTRKLRLFLITLGLLIFAITLIAGCGKNTTSTPGASAPALQPLPIGLAGYEAMPIPPDNPMSPEKVALGRQLFFDERLS